jgi:hypothetical protein
MLCRTIDEKNAEQFLCRKIDTVWVFKATASLPLGNQCYDKTSVVLRVLMCEWRPLPLFWALKDQLLGNLNHSSPYFVDIP